MASPELETGDTSLLTNILQEARFTLQEKSIAANVFNVYDMTGTPGLTALVPGIWKCFSKCSSTN